MSAATIVRHDCGRLIIDGQRCVCVATPLRECDCTFDGNTQNIGPFCRAEIHRVWAECVGRPQ